MNRYCKRWRVVVTLAALLVAARLPAGDSGAYDQVRMSPDGEYIAVIAQAPDQPNATNLMTMRLADRATSIVTGYTDTHVRRFFWANDQRLVFSIARVHATPDGGEAYRGTYSVLRDGKGGRKLHEPLSRQHDETTPTAQPQGSIPVELLHRLPTDWKNVLVTRLNRRTLLPEVHLLNVETGRWRKLVANDQYGIEQWLTDHSGVVRAAVAAGDNPLAWHRRLLYRDTAAAEWREVLSFDDRDAHVFGFHADNRRLVIASRIGRKRLALYEFDPVNGKLGAPLVSDPGYDVWSESAAAAGLAQTGNGHMVYFQYRAADLRTIYFDPRWAARQQGIDEALADTANTIVDWSDDERSLLVFAQSDGTPGDYYLYDTTRQKLQFLISAQSAD